MGKYCVSTQRIKRLRERVMSQPYRIDTERALIITESYKNHEHEPIAMKRAIALKDILENMTLSLEDDDLLMGYQSSILRAAPLFPEYSIDWLVNELDEFDKRSGDSFILSNMQKDEIKRIYPYWHGRTLEDRACAIMSDRSMQIENTGVIRALNMITCGDGHIAPNYYKILDVGIKGLKMEAQAVLASLDMTKQKDLLKSIFLRGVVLSLDAVVTFANRNASYAEKQAKINTNQQRKAELLEMARICRHVPENPPNSFYEAVQAVWFIHLLLQIESNGHSYSLGRADQYLYGFYQNDIDSGKLTKERASELLENLWIKTYTINKIRPWKYTQFSAGGPMYENVTIGGQTSEGKDAVNDLSFLILESIARTHLTQPNLTVRYHRNMSAEFMDRCIDVIKEGFGMPAFNNDEVIIPSLIHWGVKPEDAYNYSAIGCVEVAVPGKWGYRCTGMSFMNLPKIFNIMLRGGYDDVSRTWFYKGKGLCQMNSFEELCAEWEKVLSMFVKESVIIDLAVDTAMEVIAPDILCSALVDDCIQRGKTIKEGGALYDFVSGLQVGIANLGNCMAAVKKMIFDDKSVTAKDMMAALDDNFKSDDSGRIRQKMLKAPKYGCDDDYVDKLLLDAYGVYINEISKYMNSRFGRGPIGGKYYAGTSSISANVPSGSVVSATPDGRMAHEPLAEGCSPFSGTDIYGPTAVFKSISKLPTNLITGGVLLNQKVIPSSLVTKQDSAKFASLIRTFFDDLKGFHVQYNFVEKETLLDAQVHPEKHRDLIVRVAGYSAFFTVLNPKTQDDIIMRTEHAI